MTFSWKLAKRFLCYTMTLFSIVCPGLVVGQVEGEGSLELLARVSSAYLRMKASFEMKAEIARRVGRGGAGQETRRNHRIVQHGGAFRADVSQGTALGVVRILRPNGDLFLYAPSAKQFLEAPPDDAAAEDIREDLRSSRSLLYERLVELADNRPTVISTKAERIKIGADRRQCLKLELKSAELARPRWTALVWRSHMRAQMESAEIVEEDITWTEIVAPAVDAAAELNWKAPAGSERVRAFRGRLPR